MKQTIKTDIIDIRLITMLSTQQDVKQELHKKLLLLSDDKRQITIDYSYILYI